MSGYAELRTFGDKPHPSSTRPRSLSGSKPFSGPKPATGTKPVIGGTSRPWMKESPGRSDVESDPSSRERVVQAGEILVSEGHSSNRLFVLREGRCELVISRGDGWAQVLGEAGPGEAVGLASVLDGAVSEYTIRMRTQGVVWSVEGRNLRSAASKNSDLALWLFESSMASRSQQVRLASELSLMTLEQRLVRFLLRNAMGNTWSYSHEELAQRLGGCREEVTRLLSKLKRKGLVKIGRRKVAVLDEAGLRRFTIDARVVI